MSVFYHEGQFPPKHLDFEKLVVPLATATDSIARYDSFLGIIPDSSILIAPLMTQEAVTSSRIEGTKATVGDVLAYEAGSDDIDPARRNDVLEVINYQAAIQETEKMLQDIPLSGRVLRRAHAILLDGVRGQYKSPGSYRTEQNWIGRSNNIAEARYVPIGPEHVEDAMARWEAFVNESELPSLIKVSVAHAEFESIHPFLDGNGRIGRMIIPLMLCLDGVMSHPCFYLSEFFEHRNEEYQDRLLAVSESHDWTGWISFFLNAMSDQAKVNLEKARRIFELYQDTRASLIERTASASADKVVAQLFRSAVFTSVSLSKRSNVHQKTVRRLLSALSDMRTIVEISPSSGSRPAIYAFTELLEITEGISLR